MGRKAILRIVLATLLGEIVLILFTTFAQEVLFDGISYSTSSDFDIYVGGFATFVAAVLAGMVAALVCNGRSYIPHIIISILICIETTFLIINGRTNDPIWADMLAGVSLVLGIWFGHFVVKLFFSKTAD